jgi:hypothetical protein
MYTLELLHWGPPYLRVFPPDILLALVKSLRIPILRR